uniref:Secreted protein n=1 Tax=Cacopsylla melanoneura TaxID=428564 RepID=A0A8D8RWS5_9HEMI
MRDGYPLVHTILFLHLTLIYMGETSGQTVWLCPHDVPLHLLQYQKKNIMNQMNQNTTRTKTNPIQTKTTRSSLTVPCRTMFPSILTRKLVSLSTLWQRCLPVPHQAPCSQAPSSQPPTLWDLALTMQCTTSSILD